MENSFNKLDYKGKGWDHFKARDFHRNKIDDGNVIKSKKVSEDENTKSAFKWIIETVNPLNHLPIVSSVKKLITKSNKSIDIIQSAVGGFIFGGPLGIFKGIGAWAANRFTSNILSISSDKVSYKKNLDPIQSKLSKQTNEVKTSYENIMSSKNLYLNNYLLEKKRVEANYNSNYSQQANFKNKIDISA